MSFPREIYKKFDSGYPNDFNKEVNNDAKGIRANSTIPQNHLCLCTDYNDAQNKFS